MRAYTDDFFNGRMVNNTNAYFMDRWKQPGDETKTNIPRYIASAAIDQQTRSLDFYNDADINVESASYIKMRDITLAYDFPNRWQNKLAMDKLRVYAQLSNLMLWTANHQGIDPEYYNPSGGAGANANSGAAIGGIVGSPAVALPDRMKPYMTFGINVSFK